MLVLAGVGEFLRLLDILDGNQAAQGEIIIHYQHLLDAIVVQQRNDLLAISVLMHRDQSLLGGHDARDRRVVMGLEAQVTAGDDADQFFPVHHRDTGDVVLAGQIEDLADGRIRINRDRVADDAAFVLLDGTDFLGLFLGTHVLVHDTQTAGLCQGNGEAALGDGIHGRRGDRNIQNNIAANPRGQVRLAGKHLRIGGFQEYIVESQCFFRRDHGPNPGLPATGREVRSRTL